MFVSGFSHVLPAADGDQSAQLGESGGILTGSYAKSYSEQAHRGNNASNVS